jgi:hypothetical protein
MACHHVLRCTTRNKNGKEHRYWNLVENRRVAGGLRDLAPGLTPRAVLEKFSAMQMIDVHLPTTDGRTIILSRYTQPEADLQLLLKQLKLELPDQPPPKITASGQLAK